MEKCINYKASLVNMFFSYFKAIILYVVEIYTPKSKTSNALQMNVIMLFFCYLTHINLYKFFKDNITLHKGCI